MDQFQKTFCPTRKNSKWAKETLETPVLFPPQVLNLSLFVLLLVSHAQAECYDEDTNEQDDENASTLLKHVGDDKGTVYDADDL